MNEKTLYSLLALANAIESDPRVINLAKAEAKLNDDSMVKAISAKQAQKSDVFDENCRLFGVSSPQTKQAQKELFEAKNELDSLPAVQEYQRCFNAINMLFYEIEYAIFGPFKEKVRCKHD